MWTVGVTDGKCKINNIICCSLDWCLLVPYPHFPLAPASSQINCTWYVCSTDQAGHESIVLPLASPSCSSCCVSVAVCLLTFPAIDALMCIAGPHILVNVWFGMLTRVPSIAKPLSRHTGIQASTRSYPDLAVIFSFGGMPHLPSTVPPPPARCLASGTMARRTHI